MTIVTQADLEALGEDVKSARTARGWTLKQLSNEMDGASHVSFLSGIEKGKRKIGATTVGRLTNALDLDPKWLAKFNGVEISADEEATPQDQRAAQMIAAAEKEGETGVGEGLLIALAYEYAEGETTDLASAYRGLKAALETARDMAKRADLPDNTDAAMSAIRAEVQRLNEAEQLEEADARIIEALEQKQAEVSALFDLGIKQARMRNEPKVAAERIFERLKLDTSGDIFNETRKTWSEWHAIGRDKGINFDAEVSIYLAKLNLRSSNTPDQKYAALSDLGTSLSVLGQRETGTERLEQAIETFTDALNERSRDREPLDWAMAKSNLGTALLNLGQRETGTERLEQAVEAYTDALKERTRDRVAFEWAKTNTNLGNALVALGLRETGEMRLEQAVEAHTNALKLYTRDRVPRDWAKAKMNLGIALGALGQRERGSERLEQSVEAYDDALKEFSRDLVPLDWAMTKMNLGNALKYLGQREKGAERLEQAVVAYTDALKVYGRDPMPLDWALVQINRATVHIQFFDKTGDFDHLQTASTHINSALEVLKEAEASLYIAVAEQISAKIDALSKGSDQS